MMPPIKQKAGGMMPQVPTVILSQARDEVVLQGTWIWDSRDGAWEQGGDLFFPARLPPS